MKIFRSLIKLSLFIGLIFVAFNPEAREKMLKKIKEWGSEIK